MVAGITIHFAELQPRPALALSTRLEKAQSGLSTLDLAEYPASGLKVGVSTQGRILISVIRPMPRPARVKSGELKVEARMSRGDQIMVDFRMG